MATLTLIIDYLFTQMNMMYPLFGPPDLKNDIRTNGESSEYKALHKTIENLKELEKAKGNISITNDSELDTYLNNNAEQREIIKGLIKEVIINPEGAKEFIKGEWVKGYKGIEADLLDKDEELRDDVNMYDLRDSYYGTAKLKIDELNEQKRKLNSNASNEDYSKIINAIREIINAIREIKKTYNFNISAGYAVLDSHGPGEYWPDDIERVRGILYNEDDKRYKVSPTSGGRRRRSKSRKSQRKTKKSRKTKKTKKTKNTRKN